MSTNQYGSTSGSRTREARRLMERTMLFTLDEEIERLRDESPWSEGDRNSRTLAKDVDFRVLLTVLREGATLTEEDGEARVSIHVLRGTASLEVGGDTTELHAGQLATIDAGQRWQLRASSECAALTTLAWPREKAGV